MDDGYILIYILGKMVTYGILGGEGGGGGVIRHQRCVILLKNSTLLSV